MIMGSKISLPLASTLKALLTPIVRPSVAVMTTLFAAVPITTGSVAMPLTKFRVTVGLIVPVVSVKPPRWVHRNLPLVPD